MPQFTLAVAYNSPLGKVNAPTNNFIMAISNEKLGGLKFAALGGLLCLLPSVVIYGLLSNKIPEIGLMAIYTLLIIFGIVYYKKRMRDWAKNVYLNKDTISYKIRGAMQEVSRADILQVEDTGVKNFPHEIILVLKKGGMVTFFPSPEFGRPYQKKLLKCLRNWLSNTSMEINGGAGI